MQPAPHANLYRFAALLSLAALVAVACGGDPEPSKPKDAGALDVVDGSADADDATQDVDDSQGGDTSDDAEPVDGEDASVDSATDAAAADSDDTADAGPECSVDADCAGKGAPTACQAVRCLQGACVVATAAGKCCSDKDCGDGDECTTDACDTSKHACAPAAPIPNCCSGKLTLLKAGFESGLGELQVVNGAANGSVGWQTSTARARGGASSLYFGGPCGTYDNAQKVEDNCEANGPATAVEGAVTTKPLVLPKDKSIQVQFWLWLAAEPMYTATLPQGSCSPACMVGASCVSVNGASQCLPEKDVLTVSVLPEEGAPLKVFDSTTIGKTTGGAWRHVVLDLDSFQGKAVRLQWGFQTGTGFKNALEGVYLDEIVIETLCVGEGTLCTNASACKDDGNACTDDACTWYANAANKGVCFHDAKPGCCVLDSHCEDGKPCTLDTCKVGVCQHQPDASNTACCKPSVAVSADFDSGVLDGWTILDSNSQEVGWRIDPQGGTKGSQALYFGNASATSYVDASLGPGVGPKGMACTPVAKLKVGTLYNLVTFQLRMETEWSYLPKGVYMNPPVASSIKYDHLIVGVREDGVPGAKVEPLWSSDVIAGTTDGKWLEVTLALDAWQGKSVSVCLRFDAGDDQVNDRTGVHVDELAIKVACAKPECLIDAECAGLACGACLAPACSAGVCACVALPDCCTSTAACDDGNACTDDACTASKCQHSKKVGCCNAAAECPVATEVCTKAVCDGTKKTCGVAPVSGCCVKDADCQKDLLCLTAVCDVAALTCVETPIAGCCKADAACDDSNACTTDECIDLKCVHKPSGAPGCSG